MKSERNGEELFLVGVRDALNESVDRLDGEVCSRLTQARYKALAGQKTGDASDAWVPGGVFAVALTAMMVFSIQPEPTQSVPVVEDVELLSAVDFELLDELEFYEWLDEVAS